MRLRKNAVVLAVLLSLANLFHASLPLVAKAYAEEKTKGDVMSGQKFAKGKQEKEPNYNNLDDFRTQLRDPSHKFSEDELRKWSNLATVQAPMFASRENQFTINTINERLRTEKDETTRQKLIGIRAIFEKYVDEMAVVPQKLEGGQTGAVAGRKPTIAWMPDLKAMSRVLVDKSIEISGSVPTEFATANVPEPNQLTEILARQENNLPLSKGNKKYLSDNVDFFADKIEKFSGDPKKANEFKTAVNSEDYDGAMKILAEAVPSLGDPGQALAGTGYTIYTGSKIVYFDGRVSYHLPLSKQAQAKLERGDTDKVVAAFYLCIALIASAEGLEVKIKNPGDTKPMSNYLNAFKLGGEIGPKLAMYHNGRQIGELMIGVQGSQMWIDGGENISDVNVFLNVITRIPMVNFETGKLFFYTGARGEIPFYPDVKARGAFNIGFDVSLFSEQFDIYAEFDMLGQTDNKGGGGLAGKGLGGKGGVVFRPEKVSGLQVHAFGGSDTLMGPQAGVMVLFDLTQLINNALGKEDDEEKGKKKKR